MAAPTLLVGFAMGTWLGVGVVGGNGDADGMTLPTSNVVSYSAVVRCSTACISASNPTERCLDVLGGVNACQRI